jgi:hypothetical protein
MKDLGRYLSEKKGMFFLWAVWTGIQGGIFFLYQASMEPLLYSSIVCLTVGIFCLGRDFARWKKRQRELSILLSQLNEKVLPLPEPYDQTERGYQTLLRALSEARGADRRNFQRETGEMLDFYTLWVHQVKTPIAAMKLLLQTEPSGARDSALAGELTRVEDYAGMVLSYLRLQSQQNDYLFRPVELDRLIKKTLRRFAGLFIGGKLSVQFIPTGETVVTDEKWLLIVLEQLISNAVKYTEPGGSVAIRADEQGRLLISDTGIGIRKEDLPRVFERGYTGWTGHAEDHSSGLGLYLCRRILDGIGGSLTLDSSPGKGTTATLSFPEREEGYE